MYPHRSPHWLSLVLALAFPIGIPFTPIDQSAIAAEVKPIGPVVSDRLAEANGLFEQGNQLLEREQNEGAIGAFQKALVIYRELRDRQKEGQTLKAIGNAYSNLKDNTKSLEYQQQVLVIAREIKDTDLEARALINLTGIYTKTEDLPKAVKAGQQALAVAEQSQNLATELGALRNLAIALFNVADKASSDDPARLQQAAQQTIQTAIRGISLAQKMKQPRDEALLLNVLGSAQSYLGKNDENWAAKQQSLKIYRNLSDRPQQLTGLILVMRAQWFLGADARRAKNYPLALSYANQTLALIPEALQLAQALKKSGLIKEVLVMQSSAHSEIAHVYEDLQDFPRAIIAAQKGIDIARSAQDPEAEHSAVRSLVWVYVSSGDIGKQIELGQRKLELARQLNTPPTAITAVQESLDLSGLAATYAVLGDIPKSIELEQQALKQFQSIDTTRLHFGARATPINMQLIILGSLSNHHKAIGAFDQSEAFSQQLLQLSRRFQSAEAEVESLIQLSELYARRGALPLALDTAQQALTVARDLKKTKSDKQPQTEIAALIQLGKIYSAQSQSKLALATTQQALQIAQRHHDPNLQMNALDALSQVQQNQGNIAEALALLQQSVTVSGQLPNPNKQASSQFQLGVKYSDLGDYATANKLYQLALTTTQKTQSIRNEATALYGLSRNAAAQGNPQEAVKLAEQGVALVRAKDPLLESLLNIALSHAYGELGNEAKAMQAAQEALTITRSLGHSDEGDHLALLGQLNRKFGHPEAALANYQAALALGRTSPTVYTGLAKIYAAQHQPAIAIPFYKQAINTIEKQRRSIQNLSPDLQKSFLQSTFDFGGVKTADIYREFADLLIAQGSLGEAQQVMELLKIQELNDFSKTTRSAIPLTPIELSPTEKSILAQYGDLITFTQKVATCQAQKCPELDKLMVDRDKFNTAFILRMQGIENQADADRQKGITARKADFTEGATKIVAKPHTLLIYPLVLKDRVRILWTATGKVGGDTTCPIGEAQLWDATKTFHDELRRPTSLDTAKAKSKVLYDCLIAPLEGVIKANQIQHIVFAPDLATNYIPLSALYDGQQFLIQRLTIANIVDAQNTDTQATLPTNPQVLALGMSIGKVNKFSPLPSVPPELASIVKTTAPKSPGLFPGTALLNADFTQTRLAKNLRSGDINILHFATHADFKSNNPIGSFLLLGDGQELTIPNIQNLDGLSAVHLVTLSACQTALTDAKGGVEVRAISSYFKQAKTVVASLWSVNDASTALIMQQFYQQLANGKTKAESLQQVQQDFINGKLTPINASKVGREADFVPNMPQSIRSLNAPPINFTHPHYWAPFILIGNSL
jgi:CHAT domain-containing protein/tetratricopeptide (TPR) repeat protein